jgi:hypothetical protein
VQAQVWGESGNDANHSLRTTGNAAPRASAPGYAEGRDLRIDFFRGLALICIFADHIPENVLANFTLTNFGFADAAEVFVVLAGYVAYLAYGRPFAAGGWRAGLAKVAARMRDLYVAHLAVLSICVAVLAAATWIFDNPLFLEHLRLTPVLSDPLGSLGRAVVLHYQPGYLNILPLYVLLLMWLPVLLWLMRINLGVALAASAGLWLGTGSLECNLPSYTDASGWIFNPFAWQFLFSLGAISANAAAREGPLRPRSRFLFWMAASYLVLGLLVAAPWTKLPGLAEVRVLPDFRPSISKQYLSAWRLAGIVALAYVLAATVSPHARWLRRSWARWIITCGQNSLPVFCLSIVLSLSAFVILVEGGQGLVLQISVNVAGVALLCLVAARLGHWKAARGSARSRATARRADGATRTFSSGALALERYRRSAAWKHG